MTDIILFNRFTCSPDNEDGNSIVVAIDGLLVSYCVVAFSIQQPTPQIEGVASGQQVS